ncbi:PDZ domain-containing protein [Streptomyces sp. 846.5]|nr:PDZ domain-containing protein [Streptomyces sp. 846.5]TDU04319.1 PDZ domain-containing protein [Streptomyces sp. 846.5]
MPRRSATMLASTLLLIALFCAAVLIKVPYSEMSPGPTYNTLGTQNGKQVITISGRNTYPTTGNLNMTTVEVTSADYTLNLVEAFTGWLRHDQAVIPHSNLYPDNQTEKQAEAQNAEEFSASQDSAKAAALTQLGIPVGTEVVVSAVVEGSPSVGKLHAGDVIVAVDGTKVTDPNRVAALVTEHQPGQNVVFTVIPPGKTSRDLQQVTITTAKNPDTGKAMVGIQPGTEHTFPFGIDINLGDVGGPSAGLMFSLGIVDKLQSTDLTGGKFVAGTGTIDADGTVGPIGGISMKIIAARNAGAQYFFTPSSNCAEAAADTPSGLRLIKVDKLSQAVADLADIRSGDLSALPACSK